jgi:hypothetical protein
VQSSKQQELLRCAPGRNTEQQSCSLTDHRIGECPYGCQDIDRYVQRNGEDRERQETRDERDKAENRGGRRETIEIDLLFELSAHSSTNARELHVNN